MDLVNETNPTTEIDETNINDIEIDAVEDAPVDVKIPPPSSSPQPPPSQYSNGELNLNVVNRLLETEKCQNKTDGWNKLDKTVKIKLLHNYADKYGKTNNYTDKEIATLKTFFVGSLEKLKLQKTKDVVYDKAAQEITNIPALIFNSTTRNFTLKNMDPKRVSTLKSLTPKKSIKID